MRAPPKTFTLSNKSIVHSPLTKPGMGKPLFKAPDGGRPEILYERKDLTQSELQQGTRTSVLLDYDVRPEAFPTLTHTRMDKFLCSIWVHMPRHAVLFPPQPPTDR